MQLTHLPLAGVKHNPLGQWTGMMAPWIPISLCSPHDAALSWQNIAKLLVPVPRPAQVVFFYYIDK